MHEALVLQNIVHGSSLWCREMFSSSRSAADGLHALLGTAIAFEARTQPGAWLQVDWLPSGLSLRPTQAMLPALLQAREAVGFP